jgi:TonB family protein
MIRIFTKSWNESSRPQGSLVKGIFPSGFLLILLISSSIYSQSGQPAATATPSAISPQQITAAPTSAEIMRERITRAKAYLAARNFGAAIFELQSISKESSEPAIQTVAAVLLTNCYLEQGDYKRAQEMLNKAFAQLKDGKLESQTNYSAIAGQVVKTARTQAERFRFYGISTSDRMLPLEVLSDLEKLRETVEIITNQTRSLVQDQKFASLAVGLFEEAARARASIARDDFDAKRWNDSISDVREEMASSRSVIINAEDGSRVKETELAQNQVLNPQQGSVAGTQQNSGPERVIEKTVSSQPVNRPGNPASPAAANSSGQKSAELQPQASLPKQQNSSLPPATSNTQKAESKIEEKQPAKPVPGGNSSAALKPEADDQRKVIVAGQGKENQLTKETQAGKEKSDDKNSGEKAGQAAVSENKVQQPVNVGNLTPYVIKQQQPVYPQIARSMRTTGIVRVEVLLDEDGKITEIQKVTGPNLLQDSAREAIMKWKFRAVVVNGQPVKAVGYINFNYSL